MDMSSWPVQGHCFNMKECEGNTSIDEVEFHKMQMWIQIYDLSLEMYNKENTSNIGNSIGRCILVEDDNIAKQRIFIKVKLEVDVTEPLVGCFGQTSKQGEEKWATIKYERLSDECYGCENLGHTSLNCSEMLAMQEIRPKFPRYDPWLAGTIRESKAGGTIQEGRETKNHPDVT